MAPAESLVAVAAYLRGIRQLGRTGGFPISAAEALLLIGAGIDNSPQLKTAMACDPQRAVGFLRGRDSWNGKAGRWSKSPWQLVNASKHPHRRGLRLELTAEGRELLKCLADTSLLTDQSVPVE